MMEPRHSYERLFPALRREVDEEIEFHIASRAAELEREGVPAGEARERAVHEFGDMERAKRECRRIGEQRRRRARHREQLDALLQDIGYAVRGMNRRPGFALLAVLTLALGVGANTAIFRLVNATLLSLPPYPDPDRIVTLRELAADLPAGTVPEREFSAVAEENLREWRHRARAFEAMAYLSNPKFTPPMTVLGGDAPMRVLATAVSADFLAVFGVAPMLGRDFDASERVENGPPVALISHAAWQTYFGGGEVLGRGVHVFGAEHRIVGVLPPGFEYPERTALWTPVERWGENPNRHAKNWLAVGRLRSGVPVAVARSEMAALHRTLREEYGPESGGAGAVLTTLHEEQSGALRRPLLMLAGAAGMVLLIACVNLASALLARGTARTREMAVRAALGAGRSRLVRQLLTESAVLAAAGAAAGVLLALAVLRVFAALAPASLGVGDTAGLDSTSLLVALALAGGSTLLFGAAPAFRTARPALYSTLRAGDRSMTGGGGQRAWKLLVCAEVALAVLLLAGSALLVRSFQSVLALEPGFAADRLLSVELTLPSARYGDDAAVASFYAAAATVLPTVPGVESASMVNHVPFGGRDWNGTFEIEGQGKDSGFGHYRVAGPGYFETMGIPVVSGRDFTALDHAGAVPVAIINRTLARREFGAEDPIGKRIRDLANEPMKYREEWLTIVGVAEDVRSESLLQDGVPEVYVNVLQHPDRAAGGVLVLRTSVSPAAVIPMVRARLRELAPDVPVEAVPLAAHVQDTVAERRFTMLVLTAFGVVGLLLSAVGIYGVVAYAVARRLREAGIRIALGGTPRSVRALVQRDTLRMVAAGLLLGLAGALWLARALRGLLYGVSPADPIALVAAIAVLGAVAWFASWVPAHRAGRVDPIVVMSAES